MLKGDFDRRYSREPLRRDFRDLEKRIRERSRQGIDLMRKIPDRPSKLSYYEELFISDRRQKELSESREKIIGIFCNFIPQELIYAVSCIPLRLCTGCYESIFPAEELITADICPLIKSSLGFKIAGLSYFESCNLVIIPTSCDGKVKLAEILSDYLPVWVMELPHSKTPLQIRFGWWLREVKLLRQKLEEFSGGRITRGDLKEAIKLLQKRQEVFSRLYELRKHTGYPLSERDFLLVIQAAFFDDIRRWILNTEGLCKELEEGLKRLKGKPITPRILITGAPIIWPNFKILEIIEEIGAGVVMDELCSGSQFLYDRVSVDEWTFDGMLRAIAARYLLPSPCPIFTQSDDRIDKILYMVQEFRVDGVIYHNLRCCQLYDLDRIRLGYFLQEKGIPFISISTDYSPEDRAQIKTRVEAFVEMLRQG